MRDVVFNFTPPFLAAMKDNATVQAHIGPAGTGKTFQAVRQLLLKTMRKEVVDGRRNATVVVVRDTYSNLTKSTLPTVQGALRGFNSVNREGNYPKTVARFKSPDGVPTVMTFDYLAIDKAPSVKNLLEGRPFDDAILDEACTAPAEVLSGLITRLGRTTDGSHALDPTIILTTNGGYEDNWLNDICLGKFDDEYKVITERNKRLYLRVYWDEPALIAPPDAKDFKDVTKWRENPKAFNIENLPGGYGYYWTQMANVRSAPNFVRMFVLGGFVPRLAGKVVFPEFSTETHVIPEKDFTLPVEASIGLSFDFGRTPVAILWTTTGAGRMVAFDEVAMADAAIADLARGPLYRKLQDYGNPPIAWGTGDPSGLVKDQGVGSSPYEVLAAPRPNGLGIPMRPPGVNNQIDVRLDPTRLALRQLGPDGKPSLGVTSNCKLLVAALSRNYVYEKRRGSTEMKDEPTKSHAQWCSDIADAFTYGVLYQMMDRRVSEANDKASIAAAAIIAQRGKRRRLW